ncbi:MAG: serine/threonine-protein kinase [Proteobacteria bacterium]|nr:serine/threonine-protein kinase [Pseudomonadota bacterium]
MIGSVVGPYRILDLLSAGGMGTVYRAEHTLLGRVAAVKVLHPEMCANKDIVNRFFNEAKATTAIKHPGIVEIFDFGYMPSGHAFLVMEFLEGMPMSHRIRQRGPIPEGEAALILRGVCSALAAAHNKGIVHRDLKPDNIFVIPDSDSPLGERCKLLDFGIAKLTDVGLAGSATKTGAVMGTPTYMSPEQCRGTGNVDHRADLYSIGCIFYQLLTGRPPFTHEGAGELIGAHLFMVPESPAVYMPSISPETTALVMSLLDKNPDRRPQTARDLVTALTLIAHRHGWTVATSDAERMSMQHFATPTDLTRALLTPAPPSSSPSFTPYTPVPMATPYPPDQAPTTLSSAAGQGAGPTTTTRPPRRRFRLAGQIQFRWDPTMRLFMTLASASSPEVVPTTTTTTTTATASVPATKKPKAKPETKVVAKPTVTKPTGKPDAPKPKPEPGLVESDL